MAPIPLRLNLDMKHLSHINERRDSEAGPLIQLGQSKPFPRWPKLVAAALNLFALLAVIAIIGILAHSLRSYSGTRGIQFTGQSISWPIDLNLQPSYMFLAVSALTVLPSAASVIVLFKRSKNPSLGLIEKILAVASCVLFVLWIVAVVLQRVSENTPKKDLLKWACRRRQSPTNAVVSYWSVCEEQVGD